MAGFPIVIPLHKRGGKFRDNTEVRLTIRSIARHFQGEVNLTIVSEKLPEWATGIGHIDDGGKGLKTALLRAAEQFPNGFFWWYDDCVLLRDQTPVELMVTPACKGWTTAKTTWAKNLERVRERLLAEGHKAIDFSRPHGPYWFTKAMIDEAFADWPGMAGKFPFESWILSKRGWPRRTGVVRQYYGPFRGPPAAAAVFANYCDRGFTPGLRGWLEKEFPEACRFEKPAAGMEVHTIRFGDRWWMRLCAPTLDAWAARHGYPLHVWGQQPQYPEVKYCQIDMLRGFLERGAGWCMYVDSDVYVDAGAPAFTADAPGFYIREDLPGAGPKGFPRWCRRNRIEPPAGWVYRNAGVWACDREAARQMLAVAVPPFLPGCQEQHQWNHWLSVSGVNVVDLGRKWNAWCHEDQPGWFSHIAGGKKLQRLETFHRKGFIPHSTMHSSVLQFFTKVCTADRIRGKRVLEVGSFNVNGSIRETVKRLSPAEYLGVDMLPQEEFVDEVVRGEDLVQRFGKESWDVVLTAEMLEHAENWQEVVRNLRDVLKPGGLLVVSARSEGFPLHSYPGDHWRYSTDDIAALFADFATLYLCDDTDPQRPGFFFAAIKPPHALVARPTPAPRPAYHTKEAFDVRMAARKANPVTPEPFAAFYHVACMGPWRDVVTAQVAMFAEKGIRPKTFVLGSPEDVAWVGTLPLDVIGSDPALDRYETPTLEALWQWCRENPGGAALYCHTKGVSRPGNPNVAAWRELMMRHVVGDLESNLAKLAVADGIGVNWKWYKAGLSHFSGNFWMARADWIRNLESPWAHREQGGPVIKGSPWARMHAEMWFNSKPYYHPESLVCTEANLWRGDLVHKLLEASA